MRMNKATETIIANAFKLPSLTTPALERILGERMATAARKGGPDGRGKQFPKLPEQHGGGYVLKGQSARIVDVLGTTDGPMTRQSIAEAMGLKSGDIQTAISRLRERGLVTINKTNRHSFGYMLSEAAQ